ncbi:DUF4178 domain-containing protein [Chitinimonas lacunae]|uniref:DUF4178 domain-containing protein n=1 Tax=Chitinimonas lacunae TaxID=1963018 RepID=A0ABV8MRE6_9NEIS
MYSAPCPSCGAEVGFHTAQSVVAVCRHCRATLVRHDVDLEQIGRMAVLAEDRSPFSLGLVGRYRGVAFTIVGRIQLHYEDGYWNEWYCHFHDGRTGWVSEGSGLAYVTFEVPLDITPPPFDHIVPGQALKLAGRLYRVSNLERATCVGGAGELPFAVGPGFPAPAVDLREGQQFASLDYSSDPPRLYVGESVPPADLIAGMPVGPAPTKQVKTRQFKCTGCGAPIQPVTDEAKVYGCDHCGAVVDLADAQLKVISTARKKGEASLPRSLDLGMQGRLRGTQYTIIGCLGRRSRSDGETFHWNEYLLWNEKSGYSWLTETDGHWSLGHATAAQPSEEKGIHAYARYLKHRFRHFQGYQAEVVHVVGEFNWRVKRGDKIRVDDFIDPPLLLSKESSEREITWTLLEYLPVDAVAKAFRPKRPLPEPRGIAPNQPAPPGSSGSFWFTYMVVGITLLVLQTIFVIAAPNRIVWSQALTLDANETRRSWTSQPFDIPGSGNLAVLQRSNLSNNWLATDIDLINVATSQRYQLGREISYYSGSDWSEGSPDDTALLHDIPAGRYLLEIEAEAPPSHPPYLNQVEVRRGVPIWSNFWLTLILLLLPPLFASMRNNFERQRWAESDHKP